MLIIVKSSRILVLLAVGLFLLGSNTTIGLASVQDEINALDKRRLEIQGQIDEYQKQIEGVQGQSQTLQSKINNLNVQINQVQLEIKSLGLSINKASLEIGATETKISDTENKMSKHKNALAQYIKLINENDQRSLTEIILSNENLSDFFSELNNISVNQDNLQLIIGDMKELKLQLEIHQNQLEEQQTELQRAKNLQEIEKRSIDSTKAVQAKLLKDTKGQEAKFQELVKQGQQNIAALQQQISYLLQNGVTVEDAIKYGNLAAIATHIRPAFLLAEMNLESAVLNPSGSNVGKCYLRNFTNGDGVHIDTGAPKMRIMKTTRDIQPFLSITSSLGLDPSMTRVSCWNGAYYQGQPYGFGGAMGPAQFIPSTWMGYKDQVANLTGHNPANPWNIQDAFTAAAIKFAKDGASSQTKAGEIAASKRYYCGSATSTKRDCVNYANKVQQMAAEIAKNL